MAQSTGLFLILEVLMHLRMCVCTLLLDGQATPERGISILFPTERLGSGVHSKFSWVL